MSAPTDRAISPSSGPSATAVPVAAPATGRSLAWPANLELAATRVAPRNPPPTAGIRLAIVCPAGSSSRKSVSPEREPPARCTTVASWRASPLAADAVAPDLDAPGDAASQLTSMPVPSASIRQGSRSTDELSAGAIVPVTGRTAAPTGMSSTVRPSVMPALLAACLHDLHECWRGPLVPRAGGPDLPGGRRHLHGRE